MAYEQRDNSGSVFVNDRKETEKQPDRTGTAMIDGVMYYVSGWIKQGSKGQFLSLAFKRKEEIATGHSDLAHQRPAPRRDSISSGPQKVNIIPMDDDIPF